MRRAGVALILALGIGVLAVPGEVIFILDASNSMNIPFQGTPRIEWAKDALSTLMRELPRELSFGLIVFGHRISRKQEAESCRDVEWALRVSRHGTEERERIITWIEGIEAKGKTPLAYALSVAMEEAPRGPCRVILVTDGMETCGGDPVAKAREIRAWGCVVDVVGLAVKPEEEEALRGIASAGGGRYWKADELGNLIAILRGLVVAPVRPAAPPIPPELACYGVDPKIVALLVKYLPYQYSDPMWCVILSFLERNPPANVIVGTNDADTLFGTGGNDLILGLGCSDKILGFAGNDLLIGGPGDDVIQGGDGSDLVLGGDGHDILLGGPSDDIIFGEDGGDRLEGEGGNDALYGGLSDDTLIGGPGCNILDGGPGHNFIYDRESDCWNPTVRPSPCAPQPAPCNPPRVFPCSPRSAAPTASVSAIPEPSTLPPHAEKTVDEGQCIHLVAKVHDPDCNVSSVFWDANAGTFSDPYAKETDWCAPLVEGCEGKYVTVTVKVTDECGAETTTSMVIYVRNVNHPPEVDAGPDLVVDEGQSVKLLATATDPDGDPLSYSWSTDCRRGSFDNPNALTPTFTAPLTPNCEGETIVLTLTVRDACGAVAEDTVRVFVRNVNHTPRVEAGEDLVVKSGQTVQLWAEASDPDGEYLRAFWSIIEGEGDIADPTSLVTTYTAPVYRGCDPVTVRLAIRVEDPCGADAVDYLTITVIPINAPPQVEIDPPS